MFNSTSFIGPAIVQPRAPSSVMHELHFHGLPSDTTPAGPRMKARAQRRIKLTREDILVHRAAKLNEQGRRAERTREQVHARREQAKARNKARAEERLGKRLAASSKRLEDNRSTPDAKPTHTREPRLHTRQADGGDDVSSRRSVFGPALQQDCNARLQDVAARYGLIVQVIDARNGIAHSSANSSACAGESPIIIDADRAPAIAALQELGVRPAVLVDENEDSCISIFPESGPRECHQRGFIGVTGIETLIAELDPILSRYQSAWVFMSRFEADDWLSRMRQRSPQDSHLPTIRLSSDDALKQRVTLAVNGVFLFGIAIAGCLCAFHRRAHQQGDSSAGAVMAQQTDSQSTEPLAGDLQATAIEIPQALDQAPEAPAQIEGTQGA